MFSRETDYMHKSRVEIWDLLISKIDFLRPMNKVMKSEKVQNQPLTLCSSSILHCRVELEWMVLKCINGVSETWLNEGGAWLGARWVLACLLVLCAGQKAFCVHLCVLV